MSDEELSGPATKGDIVRLEQAILDLSLSVGKIQGGAHIAGSFVTWILAAIPTILSGIAIYLAVRT